MTARIRGFRLLALAVGGCLAAAVVPAAAQDWDLQVLMAPELPPYVHQLNTQHGLLQIIVTRTGSGLAGYEVRTRLRSSSGQEARSVTHPLFFSGPGVRVLTNTSPELVDRSRTDVPPAWEEMAVRGGIIPQDRYELCAAIYVEGQAVTDARCTWVYVDAAPPPVLILPTDGALMTDSWVIFSWAPTLSLTMSSLQNYYLRLAEVRTGQTLSEAIASSPYHEALVTGRSQYVYPVGALPLRPGQAYAWQVQALDTEGRPLGTNAGRSEIRSFAYLPDSGPDAMLAEIPLVSDLAVLTGLHTATVKPWADGFMVDGLAVLRFALPGGPVQVGARAEDLTISLTGGLAVTGGAVEAVGTLDGLVPPGLSDLLSVHRVRWTHREGLLAEATLRAPGDRVLARGDLAFGPMGLFGTIEATGTSERPLLEVGSGPLTLRITRVAAALPQGDVRAEGQLTLAGKPLPCTLEDFDLSSAGSQLSVRCTPEEGAVSVIAGSTRLGLRVDALTGQLAIDWTTASLDYDLALEGGVELALAGDAAGPCGASMTLGLIPASPIRVRASRFDCDVPNPTLDLGVARATLRDVRLTSLDHTPEGWDFRVRLDAELAFPGLGVHSLPLIRGIELEPQGITFPALAWTEEELVTAGAGSAFVAGFEIRPYGLRLAPFTFPWFQWAGEGAGGWDVELDLELGLPLLPMATASCLRGASLRIHGARFSDGHFFGTLQPRTLETACNLPLGPAAGLRLTAVDGSLSGAYADGRIALSGFLGVAGEMELAEPFLCPVGATMATPALAQGSLALHPDGRLEGEVTGLAPPCGFTWGALTASLSDAWLRFGMEDGHPTARMGAAMQATLDLASAEITEVAPTAETSPITVTGRLAYDFLEGRLVALEGQIPGPVEIGLPFHDPVLRFRLASAELSPRGLVVNGNQELLLGPATGAVSFHDLVVDLEDASVVDGSATIQGGLALEAEIQPSLGLWFRARPPGSRLTAEMGALLSLMGDVVLDHQGLAVTGSADAELAYAGTALDDLGTVFSDDFTFGLSPFGVRTGWADLEYQQQRVARVDPDGIHPDMAFFGTLFTGFIPDELPLPTLQTAFLQLRGPGGELRVVATEAEDGSVRLDTPIDETLDLVLPALQGTQPQPPSVALTIRDLRVDPSSFAVTAGTVAAELSAPWDLRTMGIPLVLERLAYVPASGNPDRGGLDLQGLLTLFDEVIDEVPVALRIGPDNRIRGDIALSGLDLDLASIDAVTLRLTSLEGSVDLPAEAPLTGSYSMDAAVEMSVASGRGASLEADVGLRLTESGLQVTAFEAAARGPEADCADFSFQYLAACVRQLRDLEASRDQDGRLRFDVGVDLRLAFRMGSDRWLSVELEDARLRDSGFRLPATELALGGNQQPAPALELGPATLRLTGITLPAVELDWSGERVDASVSDPTLSLELAWAGETAVGSGTVTLTSAGLSGEVVAEGPNGETLLSLGEWGDPIRLDLTRLTARFPQYSISAAGRLRFIGDPIPCTVEHLDLLRATATADVACTFDHEIPLIPGSDRMTLAVRTLSGSLQLPWQSAAPSYSMELSADVKLALTTEHRCGAGLLLSASDTGGLTVTDSEFSCSIPEPRLDLGFVRIAPRDVTLDRFEYGPDAAWDFSLSLDADVSFPHLGGYELPTLEGVVLDTAGFHFPGVALEPEDLPSLLADGPDASMDGFGLRVNGFRMDPFTFPWFNWQAGAGPWSFALDFDLTLPGLPASAPTCLRDAVFHVRNATFADSELSAALPISLMEDPGCPLPIGAGATLHLRELGGWLSGAYTAENGLALDGGLALSSDLELGEPFLCPPSTGRMTLAEAQLFLTSAGMVTGLIENLAPPCPLQLGPVQAAFADAWLSFNADENGQVARIGAEAGIALDLMVDTVTATGMLVYDLTAAAMEELDLRLHGPFELGIPFDDPALTFRFDSAQLAGPRLRIEGHHHLVLGSTTLGATFNDFQLDLDALEVVEGSVTFDAAFAFEAGITPDHVLTLEAVPLHTIMTADPGALLELSGQVTIDEDGLRSTGGAAAKLRFGEQRLDDLALDLSEDFRIGFAPFGVRAGHADLLWHDDAVARIDSRGFHPQVAFFLSHVLPARLPLPTTNVAYLMLRDADGDLLLDMEWNDGGLVLSTWPGQTVDLVMPALQRPGDAAPPAIGVAFSGFEIHPQDFSVLAGEILVALPEAWDLSELGIPLALDTVRYARRDDGDGTLTGLFLEGPLVLLESDLGADGRVRLHVDGTERLKGSIELNDVGYPVDVAGPVRVWVDALRGTLEVPLGNAIGLPDIFFHVAGRFEVGNGTGLAAAADIEATYGNTDGFQVRSFAASGSGDGCALVDFGAVAFCVDGIRSLRFSHHTQTGFDFGAELDLVITVRPMGADSLQFALMGVEVRPQGFHIPSQTLNASSRPALNGPAIQVAGASLRLLEARFPALTVGWAGEWTGVQVADTFPSFDFELKLPSFQQNAPSLANAPITLQNVAFHAQNRVLTGQILPYTFPDDGARLPLGGSLAVYIQEIAGGLVADAGPDGPRQGVDLQVSGAIALPEAFGDDAGELRTLGAATLSVSTSGGVSGTITDFGALGSLSLGPISLTPQLGSLHFAFAEGVQEVTLEAGATLALPPPLRGPRYRERRGRRGAGPGRR